ncbi:class I SAM-dependent methyltransferase [Velocimicrobium porci]|uniref:Class I SAM-dependent methyltransferase n=1 Tax=Velocimicrobium porci TaxID=2606634 RepID=A0A6L5XUD9_9FIRM|nr:class I SAM-dependent methyltransferase [Velocimicrobium porci]MSS62416.1 class I SAM-dependent methyltransferase [Velocimicrobium porci]
MKKTFYPVIRKILKKRNVENLLDIGCGTGELLQQIREDNQSIILYGTDISSKMVKLAKSKNINSAQIIEGDAEKLPYEKKQFDVVLCVSGINYYEQPEKVFAEAYRVLKKGGIFIVCDRYEKAFVRVIFNRIIFPFFSKNGEIKIYGERWIRIFFAANRFRKVHWRQMHGNRFVAYGIK